MLHTGAGRMKRPACTGLDCEPEKWGLSLSERLLHRPLAHHGDEMRAVLGRGVQIVVEAVGLHLDARYGLGRELGAERLFHLRLPEAAGAGAADADAHVARAEVGDEHTDQREARRRVAELLIVAALRCLE